jgi:thioredoxin-related protein
MNMTDSAQSGLIFRHRGRSNSLLLSWVFLSTLFIFGASFSAAADSVLPNAKDFTRDAKLSIKEEKPILVFFSAESCPYCEIVRDLYLQPMLEDKENPSKVIIREVPVDGIDYMRDFAGNKMDQQAFADQEGAYLTPVIRLYSSSGELLTQELIGFSSADFYLGFLEQSIEDARKKMNKLAAANY